MTSLLDRWLAMAAPRDAYRLERVPAQSVDDGLRWMRDWHDQAGRFTWMAQGDADRRRAIKHWSWLRWQHRAAIVSRGGESDGD